MNVAQMNIKYPFTLLLFQEKKNGDNLGVNYQVFVLLPLSNHPVVFFKVFSPGRMLFIPS